MSGPDASPATERPVPSATRAAVPKAVPTAAAGVYRQALEWAAPNAAGTPAPPGIRGDLLRILVDRQLGDRLDPRLSTACEEYLGEKVFTGNPTAASRDFEVFRHLLWRQGVVDATFLPYQGRFKSAERARAAMPGIVERLQAAGRETRGFNRWGAAVRVDEQGRADVVVLATRRDVGLFPIRREHAPGTMLELRLSTETPRSVRILVQQPDGRALETRLDTAPESKPVRLTLGAGKGRYDVELVFQEETGPVIAASFPFLVGEPFPARYVPPRYETEADSRSEADVEARVVRLVNQARERYGLPPLESSAALARVAKRHSTDMRVAGFGRQTDAHGSLVDRLQRANVLFRDASEVIAAGVSAEAIYDALMSSPTHRIVLLDTRLTHLGAGVAPVTARNRGTTLFATAVLARLVPRVDSTSAAEQILNKANALRAAAGSRPLAHDPRLARVAAGHAAAMARSGQPAYEVPNGSSLFELAKPAAPGAKALGGFVGVLRSTDDPVQFDGLADPAMERIGIGVIQLDSKEFGRGALWVTVLVAR